MKRNWSCRGRADDAPHALGDKRQLRARSARLLATKWTCGTSANRVMMYIPAPSECPVLKARRADVLIPIQGLMHRGRHRRHALGPDRVGDGDRLAASGSLGRQSRDINPNIDTTCIFMDQTRNVKTCRIMNSPP